MVPILIMPAKLAAPGLLKGSLTKSYDVIISVQNVLGANYFVCRSYRGKTGRGPICVHLNKFKGIFS